MEIGVRAPALRGLATQDPPAVWSLQGWLDALRPQVTPDTVLVGHDLGGVLAAMLAAERPVRALVLSGTSLSPWYWRAVRLSAVPGLSAYFYGRHGGRKFLLGGLRPALHAAALDTFALRPGHPSAIPDLPARMRCTARAMRLPPDLVGRLRARRVRTALVWGARDPWYPPGLARRLARALHAPLTTLDAGHLAPWEDAEGFTQALHALA
jgi:pimeloyl-ACP methyl ester carboxylesterase